MELKTTKNKLKKHIPLERVKILKKHIIDKLKKAEQEKSQRLHNKSRIMQKIGVKYDR